MTRLLWITCLLVSSFPSRGSIVFPSNENPLLEVHHTLTGKETRELVETEVPYWNQFLEQMDAFGYRIPAWPLRIYLAPDPGRAFAAEEFYGLSLLRDLAAALSDLGGASTRRDTDQIVKRLEALYPGLFGRLAVDSDVYHSTRSEQAVLQQTKQRLEQTVRAIEANAFECPLSAMTSSSYRHGLFFPVRAVLLNAKSKLDGAPIFKNRSVVLHELSHALQFGAWEARGRVGLRYRARAVHFDEIVADILGSVYLGDPRVHTFVAAGGVVSAARTMDRPSDLSFADELTIRMSGYQGGNGVRHLLWTLSREVGREHFLRTFAPILELSYDDMPTRGSLTDDELFNAVDFEHFVTRHAAFRMVANLVERTCAAFPNSATCRNKDQILGVLVEQKISSLPRNPCAAAIVEFLLSPTNP